MIDTNKTMLTVPLFNQAVEVVAQQLGVDKKHLTGDSRLPEHAQARWVLFHVLLTTTTGTVSMIGRLCHRDHSTVVYGVRKAQELLQQPFFAQQVDEVIKHLTTNS